MTVQGGDARYGDLAPDFGPYPRAVLWRGSRDHWFRVSCNLDRVGILRIAETVHPGTHTVRVPFRVTELPDGISLEQVIETSADGAGRVTAAFEMPASGHPLIMEVGTPTGRWYKRGAVQRRMLHGRTIEIRNATQTICLATRSEPVCISGPSYEPSKDWSPQARRVAFRTADVLIPVADPADESTWIDADRAFPE
ncbi:hypothetical protein [Microlunatus soli]|uniref:hypothetical protein n=1 Tax=Microlunatus soli TaxID=630515 RepID=UPI0012FAC9D3|nr:hypothetical protein [Microlunatus soli]